VGFTTGSRGKVPGKTCEKRRINNDDNNNNNNNNSCELNRVAMNFIVGVIFLAASDPMRIRTFYFALN
jgi:hypothetical protein